MKTTKKDELQLTDKLILRLGFVRADKNASPFADFILSIKNEGNFWTTFSLTKSITPGFIRDREAYTITTYEERAEEAYINTTIDLLMFIVANSVSLGKKLKIDEVMRTLKK